MTHPPLRRCVSCRQLLDRSQLWRVVRTKTDAHPHPSDAPPIYVVELGHGMGRSAYLCRNLACLEDARKRKRLERSLRASVPTSLYESLFLCL